MIIKSLITFSLLFVLGFSIVHEYVFAVYDNNHCTVSEYINEIEVPTSHDSICDIHFEYHQAFLLPQDIILIHSNDLSTNTIIRKESYLFQTYLDFFKPPIS
jgi:hypothetical protein